MVFSSSTFLFVFLPIALAGNFLLPKKFRNGWLLFASLFFYAWGEPKFVFMMMVSVIINWGAALLINFEKATKGRGGKAILTCAVAANLLLLVVFKYLNFTLSNLNRIAPIFPQTNIVLPIGISFFTFQGLSYVVDVYRDSSRVQRNPMNVGLYISFFPQLIAGPIVRYDTIAAEIKNRTSTWDDVCVGLRRFLVGLSKKILLANNMALVADVAFGTPEGSLSVAMAWFGALCYTLQIYFDFSGYSDMAIGLGRIFGFHFDENFRFPYISKSVTEFWRRWHISLGSWFRDYVYFPMGGSKVSLWKHVRNLFVVWFLTGLWHGANWTFIVWGLMYFVLLVLEKFLIHPERFGTKSIGRWGWQAFTMLTVVFGWVLFRSNTIAHSASYLGAMFGVAASWINADAVFYIREYAVLFVLAVVCCLPIGEKLQNLVRDTRAEVGFECVKAVGLYALLLLSVSYLVMGAHNPFIYFNF